MLREFTRKTVIASNMMEGYELEDKEGPIQMSRGVHQLEMSKHKDRSRRKCDAY